MRLAVIVDERDYGLNRRLSSAWAEYADALRRILVGLTQLPVPPLQGLQHLGDLGGKAARTSPSTSAYFIERLRRPANLGRDRGNGGPA